MNRKQIIHEKIKPLHDQIFELCNEHDISMVSAYSFGPEEDAEHESGEDKDHKFMQVISLCNANKDDPAHDRYAMAMKIIQDGVPGIGIGISGFMAAMAKKIDDECDCENCTARRAEQESEGKETEKAEAETE